MPPVVIWSPQSIESVRRIYCFLAEKNIEAGKAVAALLFKHAEILETFPNAGRPAADLEPEHRELLIPFGAAGYVLLYHFAETSNTITVLAVRHQKEVTY